MEYVPKEVNTVCGKGHTFCFNCAGPAHAPVPCRMARQWVAKSEEQKDKFVKMDDVKPCPNPDCGVRR